MRITLGVFFFLLVCIFGLRSQSYPVDGILRFTPPYYISLGTYTQLATARQMGLNFTLKDQGYTGIRQVRLVLQVYKESKLIAESRRGTTIGQTYQIESFVPIYVTGEELNEYFKRENLQLYGFNYNSTFQDGLYRIGFIVEDIATGYKLSTLISQLCYILQLDPPLLDAPLHQGGIMPIGGGVQPAIQFLWQPRGFGGLGQTEYELKIVEMVDPTQSGYVNFMSRESFPVYEKTIIGTNQVFVYNNEMLLNEGKKYVWRVQAKNVIDGETVAYYRNNGMSEIRIFEYKYYCPMPTGVSAEAQNWGSAEVKWNGDNTRHTKYEIEIADRNDDNWKRYDTTQEHQYISTKEAEKDYDIRVRAFCGTQATEWKKIAYRSPNPIFDIRSRCGSPRPPKLNLKSLNLPPVTALKVGDTLWTYLGWIVLRKVKSDGNNLFTGKCVGPITFFNTPILIRQHFDKAGFVWHEGKKRLLIGSVESDWDDSYKKKAINPISALQELISIDEGGLTGDIKTGQEEIPLVFSKKFGLKDIKASPSKDDKNSINIKIKGEAKSVSFPIKIPFKEARKNSGGENPFGNKEIEAGVPISDTEGNIYEVDDKGKARKIGKRGLGEVSPEEYNTRVKKFNTAIKKTPDRISFYAYEKEPLAFDRWQRIFEGKKEIENKYQNIDGNYRVAQKLIPVGMTGKVEVNFETVGKDSVIFKTPAGSEYKIQENNILVIPSGRANDGMEIYAVNKNDSNQVYGKIKVVSYEPKKLKVHLVPVDVEINLAAKKIETEINAIYYPYGISIEVIEEAKLSDKSWDLNKDGKLNTGEGKTLSRYTDEMSELNTVFKITNDDYDEKDIYLFVVKEASGQGVLGDMPIKSQFGYLFGTPNSRTIAHEIAHGYFNLEHTFSEKYNLEQSGTDNLMDYANETKLYKYQWDLMHDKGLKLFSFLQDSSAGEMVSILKKYGFNSIEEFIAACEREGKNNLYTYQEIQDILLKAPKDNNRYNTLKLTIRTFLPYNYVRNLFEETLLYLGNVRDYSIYKDVEKHGGYKTEQTIIFDFKNDKIIYNKNNDFKVPPTIELNSSSNKSTIYTNNKHKDDGTMIISEGKKINNLKYLSFKAKISAGNPAIKRSPYIDYELRFAIREDGFYYVDGIWDGFPAIEIFLENIKNNNVDLIYFRNTSDPRAAINDIPDKILDLFDVKGDINISFKGYLGEKLFNNEKKPYEKDIIDMKNKFKKN